MANQENSVWNGHYASTCYHPLFLFNRFGDLERCRPLLRQAASRGASKRSDSCPCGATRSKAEKRVGGARSLWRRAAQSVDASALVVDEADALLG
jgi:hypothetical protein